MGVAAMPRCVALVGPYLSGKTTLMEALLFAAGAVNRKGTAKDGNTVGDASAEARARQMSVELSVAGCSFMDEPWTMIDCPGSIEFAQDTFNALMVADLAVVVCEPLADKAPAMAPLMKFLDDRGIPHMVFINKMDHFHGRLPELMQALGAASPRPLALRQLPIQNGEAVTGYLDLVSERAYAYKPDAASERIEIPDAMKADEQESRQTLLESLADFDDTLLEQLLEDKIPDAGDIYGHISSSLAQDQIVPVLLGGAEHQHGVFRLWKALRHDAPGPETTAKRRGFEPGGDTMAQVFKTVHAAHTGKLSLARVWSGEITDGFTIAGSRIGGLFRLFGGHNEKIGRAGAGDIVALGRLEEARTGDVLTKAGRGEAGDPWTKVLTPVYSFALSADKREDEVKLSGAVGRLIEEDPSYKLEQNQDTHELVLWGQGEIHLAVGLERLASKYNVAVHGARPLVAYKETIRKPVQQHARHKKQSGGHGQFGDVHVEIKPLPRGAGFEFTNSVVGGSVPRQFIPSVENGVREYMRRGPLGFQLVDFTVKLYDGQFHAVDSSDQAFRTAAQIAMREGTPKCSPVLLEPIYKISIEVPSEHTSKVTNVVIGRRGQILGFAAKEDWPGWDTVEAQLPQAEMHDLIIELRSLSQGTGTYKFAFDHMAELTGRLADQVVAARAEAHAA